MKSVIAILIALAAFLSPSGSQEPAIAPKSAAPQILLSEGFAWQKRNGEWKISGESVTSSATGTLSEYAAANGISLKGRWLSVRIALEGEAAKAGFWLAGLRDEKGDLVRLALDSTSGRITNGRGRTIATLPAGAFEKPVELLLKFSGDTMALHFSSAPIGELRVSFEDVKATPSLFVERGTATFSELLFGGTPEKPPITKRPVAVRPPLAPKVPAKAVPIAGRSLDFTDEKMTALPAQWQQYFGIHFETAPGPWKTVRQFDGPALGLPLKSVIPGRTLEGPFNHAPVEMSLSWFRDYQKRTSLGLDKNLPVIVQNDIDAIYIAPWRSMIGKTQQDQIWALVKLAYGSSPGAEKRLFFQWGDDINLQSLGTSPDVKIIQAVPRHGLASKKSANRPEDAIAYAENYFAPAVEALHKASSDVFGEPLRIPVLIGSCSRAGVEANRDWFRSVLDHSITGEFAPSLKGQKVIDLVDYLTVNHPFADAADTKGLQSLWNTYGKQVRGLWITEEFGNVGRGPMHVLNRIALFFEWVAANKLDATQARLIWDFAARKRASDECVGLMIRLAEAMKGELRFGMEATDSGTFYRISAGGGRLIVIFVPATDRRITRLAKVGEIALEVGEARANNPWVARMLSNSLRPVPDEIIPIRAEGSRLFITPNAVTIAQWAVLLETP